MNRIVADGEQRWRNSPEFQAKVESLRQQVAAQYAARWTAAGFVGRCVLQIRMSRELAQEVRKITPSPASLY